MATSYSVTAGCLFSLRLCDERNDYWVNFKKPWHKFYKCLQRCLTLNDSNLTDEAFEHRANFARGPQVHSTINLPVFQFYGPCDGWLGCHDWCHVRTNKNQIVFIRKELNYYKLRLNYTCSNKLLEL
jgi:hypothetical protein